MARAHLLLSLLSLEGALGFTPLCTQLGIRSGSSFARLPLVADGTLVGGRLFRSMTRCSGQVSVTRSILGMIGSEQKHYDRLVSLCMEECVMTYCSCYLVFCSCPLSELCIWLVPSRGLWGNSPEPSRTFVLDEKSFIAGFWDSDLGPSQRGQGPLYLMGWF